MPTLNSNSRSNNGREIFAKALEELGGLFAEYRFHGKRGWKFDYYLSDSAIAIEVEGAVFVGGRHTRGGGFVKDTDKYNTATCMGIAVYRVTTTDLGDVDRIGEHIAAVECMHNHRLGKTNLNLDLAQRHVYLPRKPKKKANKLKV